MGYEIEGTIKVIMDTQTYGSGFTKREFVITVADDKYPQDIKLELVKDKVSLVDRLRPGQTVVAKFNLRGNENNGKYYNSLVCWKIDRVGGGGSKPEEETRPAPRQQSEKPLYKGKNAYVPPMDDSSDDIDF